MILHALLMVLVDGPEDLKLLMGLLLLVKRIQFRLHQVIRQKLELQLIQMDLPVAVKQL